MHFVTFFLSVWFVLGVGTCTMAQSPTEVAPSETHHYAIEVAGIRVGTLTASRQPQSGNQTVYTIVSDVKISLLVYTVKIYYKAVSRFEGKKLIAATVDARTNRGDYSTKIDWKGDHYDIVANQYKYNRQTTETQNIDFSSSLLYFYEPIGRTKVFAEYFGDYFVMNRTKPGTYHAVVSDREDDYIYENGRLVKVIKHNSVKNFVLRLLD
ncbi:hypothetical protein GCM10028807_01480 [Spirosoma daeguense]